MHKLSRRKAFFDAMLCLKVKVTQLTSAVTETPSLADSVWANRITGSCENKQFSSSTKGNQENRFVVVMFNTYGNLTQAIHVSKTVTTFIVVIILIYEVLSCVISNTVMADTDLQLVFRAVCISVPLTRKQGDPEN